MTLPSFLRRRPASSLGSFRGPSRIHGREGSHSASTVVSDTSRGVEGPGPLTLRQPAARHGGNARIDEEVTMAASETGAVLSEPPHPVGSAVRMRGNLREAQHA